MQPLLRLTIAHHDLTGIERRRGLLGGLLCCMRRSAISTSFMMSARQPETGGEREKIKDGRPHSKNFLAVFTTSKIHIFTKLQKYSR